MLIAGSLEELQDLVNRVKLESEKVGLFLKNSRPYVDWPGNRSFMMNFNTKMKTKKVMMALMNIH